MKYHLIILSLFLSCTAVNPEKQEEVDLEEATNQIKLVLEEYHEGVKNLDTLSMRNIFTEKSLYCGIDPGDIMDKQLVLWSMGEASKVINKKLDFEIDLQRIRLDQNGKSAIVIEQMILPHISPIPIRQISYLVKEDKEWLLDFVSIGLIPPGRDIKLFNDVAPDYLKKRNENLKKKELW